MQVAEPVDSHEPFRHGAQTASQVDQNGEVIGKLVNVIYNSPLTHFLDNVVIDGSIFSAAGGLYVSGTALWTGGCVDPTPAEPLTCAAGIGGAGIAYGAGTGFGAFGIYYFKNQVIPSFEEIW